MFNLKIFRQKLHPSVSICAARDTQVLILPGTCAHPQQGASKIVLITLSGGFEGVLLLWGVCIFKLISFQRLLFFPSCFDQSPVCCCKMIFHSLLKSIMYGYFKISTAYLQILTPIAVVSLQHVVASRRLQNASLCGCSRSFHPQRVSSQGETCPK